MAPAKTQLRRELRARLNNLSTVERATSARQICQRVPERDFWKSAKAVLLFAPLPDEVNIWPLLERALADGKLLTLPRYNPVKKNYTAARVADLELDLVRAAFDIFEPAARCGEIPFASIGVALIPGVGFDSHGNRLGRGRGFYDRLLEKFAGVKCGVALDEQMVAEIFSEPHDVRMNLILTPTREFLAPA
jgi:5-formyltetrahydrofolate cyclo-ligase